MLVDYKDEDLSEIIEDEDGDKVQIEALLIANRIRSLMENGMVTDKKTGQLRAVQYRDIVILSRSVATWGNTVAAVLKDCDIPAHVESNTGYFSSYEIQAVSYTHLYTRLDSEKKAAQPSYLIGILKGMFPELVVTETEDVEQLLDISSRQSALDYLLSNEAVSYTHLDVYKRQTHKSLIQMRLRF